MYISPNKVMLGMLGSGKNRVRVHKQSEESTGCKRGCSVRHCQRDRFVRVFPPQKFLNEFLAAGYDSCDQDQRMGHWLPFTLSSQEYLEIEEWWIAGHAGATENS
jgi:hypothetical protein